MMTKILIYFSVLAFCFCLPSSFWEKAVLIYQSTFDKLKKAHSKFKIYQESLPLIGDIAKGERLLRHFVQLEAKVTMGQKTIASDLPRFKFYTGLLSDLFEAHRQFGFSLKNVLPELRGNLIKELLFERKILSLSMGGNLQFFIVSLTTWSFVFLSSKLADLPLNSTILIVIAGIQILAIIVFNFSFLKLKDFGLKKFSMALEELYLFNGMVEVGLPINRVLADTRILEGVLASNKHFINVRERLFDLVNRWKETGLSPRVETGEIIRQVWIDKELGYERFLKQLELLKFVILAFFFLPAYFLYLYSIFQFFMEQ
jgi:hypothetical protein